jgi:anti-sigma regulatory factor (Ser/Thr protein kinase)
MQGRPQASRLRTRRRPPWPTPCGKGRIRGVGQGHLREEHALTGAWSGTIAMLTRESEALTVNDVATASYLHDALFYRSDDELLAAAVPFLRAGLDLGELAMVVCTPRNATLLADGLNGDPRLRLVPHTEVYQQRTPAVISAYRQMMERERAAGTGRIRVVGEVDFVASPANWAEWSRYEAVCNVALAPYPLWGMCLYDTRRLPSEVLLAAELTHPYVVTASSRTSNPRYVDPADFLRRSTRTGPNPLEATQPTLETDVLTDLAMFRHDIRTALAGSALSAAAVDDLVLAISELVTNAVLHGQPPVQVRLWSTSNRLLCTITDQGSGFDDPLAGYLPAGGKYLAHGGRGLWLARQLCDQLDTYRSPEGFTVRLAIGDG